MNKTTGNMKAPGRTALAGLLLASLFLAGCGPEIPRYALQLKRESIQQRQAQTRRFETGDERRLLAASAGVLQDLGFTLDESETELGLITASKERDATEMGQLAEALLLSIVTWRMKAIDKTQRIRVSLVTRPVGGDTPGTAVRVTFQRIVWNTEDKISRLESLTNPKLYQGFFAKLSKAVFLEAHRI